MNSKIASFLDKVSRDKPDEDDFDDDDMEQGDEENSKVHMRENQQNPLAAMLALLGLTVLVIALLRLLTLVGNVVNPRESYTLMATTTTSPTYSKALLAKSLANANEKVFRLSKSMQNPPTRPPANIPWISNESLDKMKYPDYPQYWAAEWISRHPQRPYMEPWRYVQLFALATLYYALEPSNWLAQVSNTWLSYNISECNWYSSAYDDVYDPLPIEFQDPCYHCRESVCDEEGTYQSLILPSLKNITKGFLPPDIGLLTARTTLSLSNSNIGGTVPTELGALTKLIELDLGINLLKGLIPTDFKMLEL